MKNLKLFIKFSNEFLEELFNKHLPSKNELGIEDIIPVILFNSIIEKSNSVQILLDNKHYAGIDILTRSIFEQSVILEFIMKEDTFNRSKAFFLSTHIRSYEYTEELLEDENLRIMVELIGGQDKLEVLREYSPIEKETYINEYKKLVSKGNSQKWYKVAGDKIINFKSLCKFMGENTYAQYISLYTTLSQEAHGKDISSYYTADEHSFSLTQKENSDLPQVFISKILFDTTKSISEFFKGKKIYNKIYNRYKFQFQLNIRK